MLVRSTTTEVVSITETAVVAASGTVTEITCFGLTNGAIDLTVTGGSGSYTYSWSNGSSVVATTQDLTALAAGTYTVTIVESNSCAITGTVAYTVAAAPAVLASSSTKTNVLCNGASTGAIDLTVTGGTTAYTYLL